ncbi:hypothetical protein WR25_05191 [Diploscapter pachys]|uniref:CUB domain-containing protein n=1 Tax=Diploscapter pachys TaxID=2018661 RepID=A0A2A2KZA3_9BILA|nr:hypothetical protein WR25_05191 [Diploscapter pachys]
MLIAPVGYRIRLRAIEFDVAGSGGKGSCHKDTLHVFDHESTVDPQLLESQKADDVISPGPIVGQFCGRIAPLTVLNVSSENAMSLWWHANSEVSDGEKRKGFKLHWSAFRVVKKAAITVPCSKNREFSCRNDEFIPLELACDSYADCVEQEDLIPSRQINSKCANVYLDPISSVSGVAILLLSAFIVFMTGMLCLLICCICRCLRSKSLPQKETAQENNAVNCNKSGPPQFFLPSPPKMKPPSTNTAYGIQSMPNVMVSPSMGRHNRNNGANKRLLSDQQKSGAYRPGKMKRSQSDTEINEVAARIRPTRYTVDGGNDREQPQEDSIAERIAQNERIIEKLSPIIKYKIQEFLRKSRAKTAQRRKFSLAKGLPERSKTAKNMKIPPQASTSGQRNQNKNSFERSSTSKNPQPNNHNTDYSLLDTIELD